MTRGASAAIAFTLLVLMASDHGIDAGGRPRDASGRRILAPVEPTEAKAFRDLVEAMPLQRLYGSTDDLARLPVDGLLKAYSAIQASSDLPVRMAGVTDLSLAAPLDVAELLYELFSSDPALDESLATVYEKQLGMTLDEAQEWYINQNTFEVFLPALSRTFDTIWAGAEYKPKDGIIDVYVTDPDLVRSIAPEVIDKYLPFVRLTRVDQTLADLQSAYDRVKMLADEQLPLDLGEEGAQHVALAADVRGNALRLDVDATVSLTSKTIDQLTAASMPVPLVINATNVEPVVETSCVESDHCSGPARGDIRARFITAGVELCTTAFVFSRIYIASAWHCSQAAQGGGLGHNVQLWAERSGGYETVGQVIWQESTNIDAGLSSVADLAYWYPQPTIFRAGLSTDGFNSKVDGNAPVLARAFRNAGIVGNVVCKSGATTQSESCGQVEDWAYDGHYGTFACVVNGGDSGGSVYEVSGSSVTAVGIIHGFHWGPGGYGTQQICSFTFTSEVEGLTDATVTLTSTDRHGDLSLLTTPRRVVDSRTGLNSSPLQANSQKLIDINTGWGYVPSTAIGVVVNVAVVQPSSQGWLEAFTYNPYLPNNGQITPASTLNFVAGQTRANSTILPVNVVSGHRYVGLYSSQGADIIIDLEGFLMPPSKYLGASTSVIAASRLFDGTCYANATCTVPVTLGSNGVVGVMLTVTVAQITADGYLEAAGTLDGTTSTLNFQASNGPVANLLFAAPSNGTIKFRPSQTVRLMVDRRGAVINPFSSSLHPVAEDDEYHAVTRDRRIDTVFSGTWPISVSPSGMASNLGQPVVLQSADSVVATVVGLNSTADAYCWISAADEGANGTSVLNLSASGAPNSDTVVSKLKYYPGAAFLAFGCSAGSSRRIVDVVGYFD